jgi:hypothetical protein
MSVHTVSYVYLHCLSRVLVDCPSYVNSHCLFRVLVDSPSYKTNFSLVQVLLDKVMGLFRFMQVFLPLTQQYRMSRAGQGCTFRDNVHGRKITELRDYAPVNAAFQGSMQQLPDKSWCT